jgi:hypothetical protein
MPPAGRSACRWPGWSCRSCAAGPTPVVSHRAAVCLRATPIKLARLPHRAYAPSGPEAAQAPDQPILTRPDWSASRTAGGPAAGYLDPAGDPRPPARQGGRRAAAPAGPRAAELVPSMTEVTVPSAFTTPGRCSAPPHRVPPGTHQAGLVGGLGLGSNSSPTSPRSGRTATVIADDGEVRCQEGCLLRVHPILPILLFVYALGAHPFIGEDLPVDDPAPSLEQRRDLVGRAEGPLARGDPADASAAQCGCASSPLPSRLLEW